MTKKQTKKIGVSGCFINQLMGNNSTTPVAGQGATRLWYSDRTPYEVVWVSDDGNSCGIRSMDWECVGTYLEQRYKLTSNPENNTIKVVWNKRKSQWCIEGRKVQIIKSIEKRLWKEFGFNWLDNLPNGHKIDELIEVDEYGIRYYKLVEGITKEYKTSEPISIIFGFAEKYQDPSF